MLPSLTALDLVLTSESLTTHAQPHLFSIFSPEYVCMYHMSLLETLACMSITFRIKCKLHDLILAYIFHLMNFPCSPCFNHNEFSKEPHFCIYMPVWASTLCSNTLSILFFFNHYLSLSFILICPLFIQIFITYLQ